MHQAGLVQVKAQCEHGKATQVELRNAPAFCRPCDMGVEVDVPLGVGKVTVDIAYGGMFYVIVDAASVGLVLEPQNGREICRLGEMIKVAAREQHPVNHPEIDYPGPDILAFRDPAVRLPGGGLAARNAVVMSNGRPRAATRTPLPGAAHATARAAHATARAAHATASPARRSGELLTSLPSLCLASGELRWDDPATHTGMLDRSPCGTGTCAIMAALHARGELRVGEPFEHSSILGTKFIGRLHEEVVVGGGGTEPVRAVVPTISGRAWITQHATVVCDPSDPFPEGYKVGDIW